jgi:ABC-type sugar transport system ATPase subunit
VGERQLVAIARALSLRARIILMDEPTSSLFDDADRVTVLRDGKTVGTRAIQEVSSAELIRMMIGKEWPARDRKRAEPKGEVVLSFPNVTTLTSPS